MGSSTAQGVQRTYLLLMLLSTLAASFIWGINTLFLLDAGLSNTEAFAANAFFTLGGMLFEIPTGVVADTWGRRASYLLGAATLLVSTLLYLAMWQLRAPFWAWAVASMAIGLGFTFFSGATEAWLVDALAFAGHKGKLDDVLARGQVVSGAAMLGGTMGGGFVAQFTNLGVPYMLRAGLLGLTLLAAAVWMKDLGFSPARGRRVGAQVRAVLRTSLDHGMRQPGVRWVMLAGFCSGGIGIYGFYAAQPFLLQLYGGPGRVRSFRRVGGRDRGFTDRGGFCCAVSAPLVHAANSRADRERAVGRALALCDVPSIDVRRCSGRAGRLELFDVGHHAAPADVSERSHSIGAACHGAVLRQPDDVGGRRPGAARARPRRRRARLPFRVLRIRIRAAQRAALSAPGAASERGVRSDREGRGGVSAREYA
jgi:MFS family permease